MALMAALLLRFQYSGQNPHSRKKFALVLLVAVKHTTSSSPIADVPAAAISVLPYI
jgi:hypothetical protein